MIQPAMRRHIRGLRVLIRAVVMISAFIACADSNQANEEDILARVQDSVLTPLEFKQAFEIAKSAYSHNEMQDPMAFREAQMRLLNQLTEEMVILERALALDIAISDAELEKAVSDYTEDYPDGAFEQILLEYAVSYPAWKERLRARLLMEKVIEEELKDNINISPKDILAYYEAHYHVKFNFKENSKNINELLVKQLRREKAENAYRSWIQELKQKYIVHVNKVAWEKIAKE